MKAQLIWSGLIVGALTLTQAQADGTNRHDRTFGDGTLPEFLEVYDLDGDGVLSEEERQAMREARREAREERREERFDEWDTDDDGELSEAERRAAREALRARIEARRLERFTEADTDGDGFLSLEEFSAIPAVARLAEAEPDKVPLIFDRLDADDDQLISEDEFLAHLRHRTRHREGDGPVDGPGPGPGPGDGPVE